MPISCKTTPPSVFAFAFLVPLVAAAQPAITAGRLGTGPVNINKPDPSPVIDLDITGTAVTIGVDFQSPSGLQSGEAFFSSIGTFYPGVGITGHVVLKGYNPPFYGNGSVLGPYSEPGTWTLINISVCGITGQCTQYYGTSLAAIFPSLTFKVLNSNTPDIVPPTATSATIKTRTVNLATNPIAQIDIMAKDNLSGVNSVQALANNSTNTNIVTFSNPPPLAPKTSGTFALYAQLSTSQPTGTYTIQNVILSDIAGNNTFISDQPTLSKLFKGKLSFTVEN